MLRVLRSSLRSVGVQRCLHADVLHGGTSAVPRFFAHRKLTSGAKTSGADEEVAAKDHPGSFVEVKVDRAELGGGYDKLLSEEEKRLSPEELQRVKEPITPLAAELKSYIKNRGPLSINEFMTQALTHNVHGYYVNKVSREKIGAGGDFITSPEISPLFGEMLAVWCVSMWEHMGCPPAVNLVELGPGNGTLMKGILDLTAKRFPAFAAALHVRMVEVSDEMRLAQMRTLGCEVVQEENNATIGESTQDEGATVRENELAAALETQSQPLEVQQCVDSEPQLRQQRRQGYNMKDGRMKAATAGAVAGTGGKGHARAGAGNSSRGSSKSKSKMSIATRTPNGIHVTWYKQLQQIYGPEEEQHQEKADGPDGRSGSIPLLVLGQEFLDAFPVYQFAHTAAAGSSGGRSSGGWREKLIDVDESADSPFHFRVVLAGQPTPAARLLLGGPSAGESTVVSSAPAEGGTVDDLIPPGALMHGLLRSSRMSNPQAQAGVLVNADSNSVSDGDVGVEVSPMALGVCEAIAQMVARHGGAALFVDYGEDYTQSDSLRGFRRHKQVHFLSEVGQVDITADVDFYACARAVRKQQQEYAKAVSQTASATVTGSAVSAGGVVLDSATIREREREERNKSKVESPTAAIAAASGGTVAVESSAMVSNVLTQGEFLLRMGIVERAQQLLEYTGEGELTDEEANAMVDNMKKIVAPTEMGGRFKAMAIVHKDVVLASPVLKKAGPGAEGGNGTVTMADGAVTCSHLPAFTSFA